jgi:hypothetical protein
MNNKFMSKKNTFLIFSLICFFVFCQDVFGAQVFFNSEKNKFSQDEIFQINILINTQGEDINAISGQVIFPLEFLELKNILDNKSIIDFWLEKPNIKNNTINFAGVIKGGYIGENGRIFSLVFGSKNYGKKEIFLENFQILKNDGKASPAQFEDKNFSFEILKKQSEFTDLTEIDDSKTIEDSEIIKDIVPPKPFDPILYKNKDIFDNKYFLIFLAEDLDSGISHYEVKEGENGKFIEAESPYLLQNQEIDEIYIKAVDKNNNERVEVISGPKIKTEMPWYKRFLILICSGVCLALLVFRKIVFKI